MLYTLDVFKDTLDVLLIVMNQTLKESEKVASPTQTSLGASPTETSKGTSPTETSIGKTFKTRHSGYPGDVVTRKEKFEGIWG